MSWLHEEQERGKRYAELLSLLLQIRRYLLERNDRDQEAAELARRVSEYTRNPV